MNVCKVRCVSFYRNDTFQTYKWVAQIRTKRPEHSHLEITLLGETKTWRGLIPIDAMNLRHHWQAIGIAAEEDGTPKLFASQTQNNQYSRNGKKNLRPTRYGEFFKRVPFEPRINPSEKKLTINLPESSYSELTQILDEIIETTSDEELHRRALTARQAISI